MAQRKLTMRKIKEILRLKWGLGLSERQVSASLKVAHSTVGEYVKRADRAGLDCTLGDPHPLAASRHRLHHGGDHQRAGRLHVQRRTIGTLRVQCYPNDHCLSA